MTESASKHTRISREFAQRLDGYEGGATVRVAIVLDAPALPRVTGRAKPRDRRQQIVRETRAAANTAIDEIDEVIEEYGGRRLAESADALGSIAVETTALGIRALANIKNIKAILEDQPVFLAR